MPALLAGATAFGAISAIGGGISSSIASAGEARLQRQQGDIAQNQAQIDATNEAYNQNQAVGRQQISFLANGVSLEGSPSTVIKSSQAYGQSMVNSILNQGAARKALSDAEATQTINQGRAALIAGIAQGVSTTGQGIYSLYKGGAFDSSKKTGIT